MWRIGSSVIILLMTSLAAPGVSAAGPKDRPLASEAAPSPWQHEMWRQSGPEMRHYICGHSARRPAWCVERERELKVYEPKEPEPIGPAFSADDSRWYRLLTGGDPESFNAEDVRFIRHRAEATGDPDAMEILGFLYANGYGTSRDPAEAYIWYGRAALEGKVGMQPNMDLLWAEIVDKDKTGMGRIQAYFADYRPHNRRAVGEIERGKEMKSAR